MNETLTIPLGEQEHLKEFFRVLTEQGKGQEAAELSSLMSQLNHMEKQYTEVLNELKTVRGQLSSIQDKGIKEMAIKGVLKLQEKVAQARNQLAYIKADISRSVKQSLAAMKQHGISALNKAVDFIGLKIALTDMRDTLHSSISQTQKHIDKINAVGSELHALNEHTKNLGRVLTGKETKELTQRNEDKGILAAVAKPLKHSKSVLEGMERNVTRAMKSIDRLEQAANKGRGKKSSIRAELKENLQNESSKKVPATHKKQDMSL